MPLKKNIIIVAEPLLFKSNTFLPIIFDNHIKK